MFKNALIMAAGRGNRMRPLTDVTPKALAPFKGSTLIEQSISKLAAYGVSTHVTVGYLGNILAETLIRKKIVASIINTEGHDNGWWLFNSICKNLDEPLLVLTCDNVTDLDLEFISAEYERLKSPACMLVGVKPIPGIEGDLIQHNDFCVTEISRECVGAVYASGIQVINPVTVNGIISPSENFSTIWKQLIRKQQLYVSREYKNSWFSIDTLDHLIQRNEK